ncbi:MAG: lysozyme [Deltaproteobacteria bacterium]|nr:lysozyme [Deltaproteobacteria bacterium]
MNRKSLRGRVRWIASLALVAAAASALWAYEHAGLAWRVRRRFPVGVDVSHHQGAIDWQRVSKDGIAFAFIKATEGGTWTDPLFATNWSEARKHGIPRGAYHFFTFCTQGEVQARHFLQVVPQDPDALPTLVDLEMEGNCSRRPSVDELERELTGFLSLVEAAQQRKAILYVTEEFLREYGRVASQRQLFIRAIGPEPPRMEGRSWTYWQFDDEGRVDGINGPVDLDAFVGEKSR